jgi:hypothetical protein
MHVLAAGRMSTRIGVIGTDLEGAPFDPVKIERTEDDWVTAWVADNVWTAEYGPLNHDEAHGIFLEWAEQTTKSQ